jgi:acetate kinase
MPILVVNSGSSSVKYQVQDVDSGNSLLEGLIERVTNHDQAFEKMLEKIALSKIELSAIGHRVVHGGAKFSQPTIINQEVLTEIEALVPLAPLHNPGNLAGIRAARAAFPDLLQVAVFDTAFHQSMPASSYLYAIEAKLAKEYGVRKYGFHGTSYSFVAAQSAKFLGVELQELNAVILHLGNGASACAVKNGKSFDTSMGMTPLQGLVMGTRSGDIDPGIIFYLAREARLTNAEIDRMLNVESGLKGLTGISDMRDIGLRAAANEPEAIEALEIYVQRVKHYLGAYIAELGDLNAIVFTAGVGENSAEIRSLVCANLQSLGIEIDERLNQAKARNNRDISTSGSRVRVLVVPTNEELEIANQTAALTK